MCSDAILFVVCKARTIVRLIIYIQCTELCLSNCMLITSLKCYHEAILYGVGRYLLKDLCPVQFCPIT